MLLTRTSTRSTVPFPPVLLIIFVCSRLAVVCEYVRTGVDKLEGGVVNTSRYAAKHVRIAVSLPVYHQGTNKRNFRGRGKRWASRR